MSDAHEHESPVTRSAGLAFILGLTFGGVALFYVLPLRRAAVGALISYGIVVASGGILWAPVFLGVALWAARQAKFSERGLAFAGSCDLPGDIGSIPHSSESTTPSAYVRVR